MTLKTYIYIFFILVSSLFIFSCDSNDDHIHEYINGVCTCGEIDPLYSSTKTLSFEQAQEIYNKVIKDLPTYMYLGDKLNLPNEIEGNKIEYSIDDNKYMSSEFVVTNVEKARNRFVTIYIIIGTHKFDYEIKIHQDINTFFEKVLDYLDDYIPNGNVVEDLKLEYIYPGEDNLKISYVSNKPEFVTNEGVRIEHEYDEDVTITCFLTKDGHEYSKDYTFESRGIPYDERYQITLEYLDEFFNNTQLVEGLKLPTEHPLYGGRIRWLCEDPTIIYDYETIHLPKEQKETHLMAEVRFGSTEYHFLTYPVTLEKRPSSITDEVYAKTFLETVLKEYDDYLVLYDGTKANINTEYLIDETQMEVNYKMYSGVVRPTVPQETLDKLVYQGYQMPNAENVLWIVVHETGTSYAGKDALVHAKLQVNNAINDGREASWTYTVDDHSIYQSFPDTYRLWHATDGSRIGGGNSNGIGIEMCVNSDGKYNVSMRNNARLMAGLLSKYGLGMMNMKRHYDFYEAKSCPEIIIRDWRWYEYLTMIEREYISQTILSNLEITYEIDAPITGVEDVYDLTKVDSVDIKVTINGESFTITSKKN